MSDVTLIVNEPTFGELFNKLWPSVHTDFDEDAAALLYLRAEGEFHVVGAGKVVLNDGNTFTATEIDLAWDKLILHVGIDIPTITVGKFCVLPLPDGDGVGFPGGEVFPAEPEYSIKLNLNAILQHIITEVSTIAAIEVKHGSKKGQDYWGIHVNPEAVNLDLIDIEDTLGKADVLMAAAIAGAVKYITSIVPGTFAIDALLGIVGFPSLSEYILDLLDVQDDVEEWLMDTLRISIGIDQVILQLILDALLDSAPLSKIDDPITLMEEETDDKTADYGSFGDDGLAPPPPPPPAGSVLLPRVQARVKEPKVFFNDHEMVVTFDFAP